MVDIEALNTEIKESVKIERNSRGYTWSIRLNAMDKQLDVPDIDRAERLNNEMLQRFGSGGVVE